MDITSEQEEKYKYYQKESDHLREWYMTMSSNLDKLIFGLSSGTIVLSITYIDKIISINNIEHIWLLRISWAFLIITLIINVLTHIFVMADTIKGRKRLDEWLGKETAETPKLQSKIGKFSNAINTLSVITLIFGISFLAYFASLNIKTINIEKNNRSNEKSMSAFENDATIENTNTENNPKINPEEDKTEK